MCNSMVCGDFQCKQIQESENSPLLDHASFKIYVYILNIFCKH